MLSTLTRPLIGLPSRLLPGRHLRSVRTAAAHLLWPWRCPLCGTASLRDVSLQICAACARAVDAEQLSSHCPGCGSMDRLIEPGATVCPACRSHPKTFTAIAVVGSHRGSLRQLILRWKFGRHPGLESVLGDMLSDALARQSWRGRIDGLVPIPQPWNRWLSRQFFPVGDLAARVGQRLGIPIWPVLRVRRHRPQVGLSMEERVRNVRGVFRTRRRVDVRGWRLCLVDDVTTTGATLQAAATALCRAGARQVYAAVLAKSGA